MIFPDFPSAVHKSFDPPFAFHVGTGPLRISALIGANSQLTCSHMSKRNPPRPSALRPQTSSSPPPRRNKRSRTSSPQPDSPLPSSWVYVATSPHAPSSTHSAPAPAPTPDPNPSPKPALYHVLTSIADDFSKQNRPYAALTASAAAQLVLDNREDDINPGLWQFITRKERELSRQTSSDSPHDS